MNQICFFEDNNFKHFYPLTLTRPVDQLRVGILRIFEKWTKSLKNESHTRILRHELKGVFPSPFLKKESCLWINPRFLPDSEIVNDIASLEPGEGLQFQNEPVIFLSDAETSQKLFDNFEINSLKIAFRDTVHGDLIHHITDILHLNGTQIESDLRLIQADSTLDHRSPILIEGRNPVYAEENVHIEPGSIFLTDDGPVYLAEGSHIMAGTMIRGPVALGEHSTIKMGAKIYSGTTIGPHSKVGGELNNVVIQGYSNKAHDGFLGNSILGEWCNLGADTNNSNLKNNYSTVRMADFESGEPYDTGLQFCGMIMGDHCKTAINTMINTGSIFGVSCNIASGDFPPKLLPSFSWYAQGKNETYDFDKAMQTSEKMMIRRGLELTDDYRAMMKYLYENR